MTVAMVRAELRLPRTFSMSRMTLAGLKKWVPITDSGREVAAASASTSSVDVFVARTASGLHTASSRRNTSCFRSSRSKTASTTMSASRTSS